MIILVVILAVLASFASYKEFQATEKLGREIQRMERVLKKIEGMKQC